MYLLYLPESHKTDIQRTTGKRETQRQRQIESERGQKQQRLGDKIQEADKL